MPKVKIPTPLRQYTGGESQVEVGGGTAGDTLGNLATEYPDLKQHLYTGDGKLRSFVNVYKGDEDIRYLDGPDTEVADGAGSPTPPPIPAGPRAPALADGDELSIIPSIAGGTGTRCP